jgi:glycosyltransferase involved in cell wall biosynthesis
MRILASTTLHGWSAGSWYLLRMLGGLAARDHPVRLLVPEGTTAERARAGGLAVVHEPDLRSVPLIGVRPVLAGLRRLYSDSEPDLLLVHGGPDHAWWGWLAGPAPRPVPVVRLRAHDPRPPSAHPLSRWLHHARTDLVVVANEPQRRGYVDRFRLTPGRVLRVPPGFDPAEAAVPPGTRELVRRQLGVPEGIPLVASIARFAPQKDHSTFLAAAARLAAALPEVHFLVAGYAAEYDADHIRGLAARHPALTGRWHLFDQRLDDGTALVAAADIGVVHSRSSEAICRVAFEYLAAGVPVVATTVGGLPETIVEWQSGLLVPPGDPEALAGALLRLLRVPGLARRLAAGGRARLAEHFDPAAAIERFETALLRVARGAEVR